LGGGGSMPGRAAVFKAAVDEAAVDKAAVDKAAVDGIIFEYKEQQSLPIQEI